MTESAEVMTIVKRTPVGRVEARWLIKNTGSVDAALRVIDISMRRNIDLASALRIHEKGGNEA